jgi:hypothetical protein
MCWLLELFFAGKRVVILPLAKAWVKKIKMYSCSEGFQYPSLRCRTGFPGTPLRKRLPYFYEIALCSPTGLFKLGKKAVILNRPAERETDEQAVTFSQMRFLPQGMPKGNPSGYLLGEFGRDAGGILI